MIANFHATLTASHRTAAPNASGRGVGQTLALRYARHQQRRALAELPRERLADIGVSEADAAAEARKPFWVR